MQNHNEDHAVQGVKDTFYKGATVTLKNSSYEGAFTVISDPADGIEVIFDEEEKQLKAILRVEPLDAMAFAQAVMKPEHIPNDLTGFVLAVNPSDLEL